MSLPRVPPILNPPSPESLICQCFRNGLIVGLGLDPSQATISVAKMFDKNWTGKPFYQVVLGACRPDGPGLGSQAGGTLFRTAEVTVTYYGQSKLDPHSLSSSMVIDALGALDAFEAIREVFAYTFFAAPDGNNALLAQPAFLSRESQTLIEDPDTGVFSRDFVFSVQYGVTMPSSTTLTFPQVANSIG
jgi:hypothetical protein